MSGWAEARNVLAVRLDNLGDLLMTTPAIRALAEGGRRVSVLTSPAAAPAAEMVPEIDDVLIYDAPWVKATAARTSPAPDLAQVETLRSRAFDGAVIFTVHTQSALPAAMLCYLAGIPRRLAHGRENPYQLLTDWVPEPEPGAPLRHEVRRQLDLVATVGAVASDERLSLRVPPASADVAFAELAAAGIDPDRPWLVLHPGASAPSRRYPAERFAQAAEALVQDHGWQVALTGSAEEADLTEWIGRRVGAGWASLAGRLRLPELAALISLAPVLITNNTGPSHIAAAVGTPVVVVYALTNLQHPPWKVPRAVLFHDVPCKGCLKSICPEGHHLCLRGVAAEQVVEAANSLGRRGLRAPVTAERAPGSYR